MIFPFKRLHETEIFRNYISHESGCARPVSGPRGWVWLRFYAIFYLTSANDFKYIYSKLKPNCLSQQTSFASYNYSKETVRVKAAWQLSLKSLSWWPACPANPKLSYAFNLFVCLSPKIMLIMLQYNFTLQLFSEVNKQFWLNHKLKYWNTLNTWKQSVFEYNIYQKWPLLINPL